MALTEQRVINQVAHFPRTGILNVQWAQQILRDGEVISQTYERTAYSIERKAQFESDLGADAAQYIALAGW